MRTYIRLPDASPIVNLLLSPISAAFDSNVVGDVLDGLNALLRKGAMGDWAVNLHLSEYSETATKGMSYTSRMG